MIKGDRLRGLLEQRRISQSELARRVGVSQTAIHKLTLGDGQGSKHLHRIARELATTPAYLTGEANDPSEGALPLPTPQNIAEQLDLVPVAHIDLQYGLGGTFTDNPVEVEVQHFPRAWLETITHSPPVFLTWTRGRGDSMMPTINDGDLLLIDRSQTRVVEQDALWAFTIGDIGMVKRLRIRAGRATILSDNANVTDDIADVDEINIVGRVAFVGRRV